VGKKQPRRPKHVPQRTCIVCREKFDKRRLIRIVRTPDDGVVIDVSGKRNGRGAYLCDQVGCWENAIKKTQLLDNALATKLTEMERREIAAHRPIQDVVTE